MASSGHDSDSRADNLAERVASALQVIRPMMRLDGGDVELVDVDDNGVVRIRLHGACVGCPSSPVTVSLGIERGLKERVPEVTQVICV